ncbi:MAG: hypothetical protein HQL48_02710 [Gammaproteobacteria bacterium]|nr:hypothetical protein [Gammaproteobacteria bacterium]
MNSMSKSGAKLALLGVISAASLIMSGCTGDESSTDSTTTGYLKASAASLATISAEDYSDNSYGLISGSTLTSWIDNWATNKPAGINGELIILQVSDGALGDYKYFKPAAGVRSYSLGSSTWVETRDNGVTETVSVVLSGKKMDALLAAYDIDPNNDMIVFAMGHGGGFQSMLMGRAHYLFRYWGAEATHLAMLNGGATHASVIPAESRATYLGTTNSGSAPTGGTVSVKDLTVDNTILQATLGDMMSVARGEVSDAFIIDARSPGEWGGDLYSTGGTSSDCIDVEDLDEDGDTTDTYGCKTAMNGTIHSAANLNYVGLLITDDGTEDLSGNGNNDASYRYLDKTSLAAKISDTGYTSGKTIYTYCRTTYRAMVVGTASGVVLGYPTRFYDGAMIEWLQMANVANKSGSDNLPATSPWQTSALTDNLTYNTASYVDTPTITDAYAGNTSSVVNEDIIYKAGSVSTLSSAASSSSSEGNLPANPCGG